MCKWLACLFRFRFSAVAKSLRFPKSLFGGCTSFILSWDCSAFWGKKRILVSAGVLFVLNEVWPAPQISYEEYEGVQWRSADLFATFCIVIWSMNSRLNNSSPQEKTKTKQKNRNNDNPVSDKVGNKSEVEMKNFSNSVCGTLWSIHTLNWYPETT